MWTRKKFGNELLIIRCSPDGTCYEVAFIGEHYKYQEALLQQLRAMTLARAIDFRTGSPETVDRELIKQCIFDLANRAEIQFANFDACHTLVTSDPSIHDTYAKK